MRTETTTITIYKFDELSDKAKEKVIDKLREIATKDNLDELIECMDEAMYKMGIKDKGYSIDLNGSGHIDLDVDCDDLEGVRAYKYIVNNFFSGLDKKKLYYKEGMKKCRESKLDRKDWMENCPCTGWCYDYAVKAAWENWCADLKEGNNPSVRDFLDGLEWAYLKEQFDGYYGFGEEDAREIAEANEYEFLEDGTIY